MRHLRFLAAGVLAGLFVAAAPACITDPECGPSNCLGCCNANGACVLGNLPTECGTNGGACSVCSGAQVCNAGLCIASGGGGGGGSDGGGNQDGGTTDGGGTSDGGTQDGGGGGTDGGLTLDNLCSAYAPAFCAFYTRCGLTQTVAGCEKMFAQSFGGDCVAQQRAGVKDGRITFDGAKAKVCLDAFANTLSCDADLRFSPVPECEQFFVGLVPTGGTCYADEDCGQQDACTSAGTQPCPGTCQQRRSAGQTLGTGEECRRELATVCSNFNTCSCYTRPQLNQSCAPIPGSSNNLECAAGLYCESASKTCKAKKSVNAPCSAFDECGGGTQCQSGSCKAFAGLNAACSFNPYVACKYDLYCSAAGAAGGVCLQKGGMGAACLNNQECEQGLFCFGEDLAVFPPKNGTCTQRSPAGATCTEAAAIECNDVTYCEPTTVVCTPKKGPGGSCTFDGNECASNTSCDGTMCVASSCEDPTP